MNWEWPKQIHLPPQEVSNSFSCCIGAIMQIDPNTVPNFAMKYTSRELIEQAAKWCFERDYMLLTLNAAPSSTIRMSDPMKRAFPVICTGPSIRSASAQDLHSVVKNEHGHMLYDPHPSNDGLLACVRYHIVVPKFPGA